MQTKNELRKKAKEIRKSLDIKKISGQIVEKILENDLYKNAQHIMLFYPIRHETDLRRLLKDKSKTFYLPKVEGKNLVVCPYNAEDTLILSAFKTQEPITAPINDTSILDIIFVPALMVDKSNNRLGYGGGFYDRFLCNQSNNTTKIVAIASALIIDKLPCESFDKPVDIVIIEN